MALRLQRRSSLVNDATPPTTLPPASEGVSLSLPGDALARPEGRKAEAAPPRRGMLAALPVQRRRRVTVDIHDGVARVVLLRGLQVVAWGKATLPPGALVGEEATGDALPSTEQLRALLRDLCPRKARLVTSLPSSLCLIRELRLPRMAGRYLRQVVAAELLESVPFSQAEVDIAWRRQRAGRGYAVVAAVAPAQAVDLHVGLLRGAAARPRAAYPRPVALALACGLADGILLDLGSRSVELALVKNGVPQIQHQLDMPGPWDEDMSGTAALALAVEQMAAYGGEEDAASIGGLPVAITGEKALEQGIAESLEVALDREVRPVLPPVAYPDHFPVQEYAAALGLALADQSRPRVFRRTRPRSRVALDVLPQRHRPKPFPWSPLGAALILLLLGYLALPLSQQVEAKREQADLQTASVERMEQEKRSKDLGFARAKLAGERLNESTQLYSSLMAHLQTLDSDMQRLQLRIQAIIQGASSEQVELSTIVGQGDSFLLSGSSAFYQDILGYAGRLQATGLFNSVKVLQMQSALRQQSSGPALGGANEVTFQARAIIEAPRELASGASTPTARPPG